VNAVSDASPLIVLARIGRFDLLTKLYQTIYISSEVYAEVTVSGAGLPGASLVANADWIEVKPIKNRLALLELQRNTGLDIGELGASFWPGKLRWRRSLSMKRPGES
jgi:predicted nucleic acid-binding protein